MRGRNNRTAAGAYEGPSAPYNAGYASTTAGHRGGGFDNEDDAWDTRVGGYNPYEEERELGLVPPHQGPGAVLDGEGYRMNLAVTPAASGVGSGHGGAGHDEEEGRGRTRSRSPGPAPARGNPFDDEAELSNMSLRGVSPRPMEAETSFAARKAHKRDDDRRSIFREDV